MTLYLNGTDLQLWRFADAFLSPHFTYVIGPSQDLAYCRLVQSVDLELSENAFFAHTLVPYDWRPWVFPGTSVMMPEVIDYRRDRQARQTRYLQITSPPLLIYPATEDTIARDRLPATFLVDDDEKREFAGRSLPRGLCFHPVLRDLAS